MPEHAKPCSFLLEQAKSIVDDASNTWFAERDCVEAGKS